ncbi:Acetyltransferase (GNAT) domain protein [anaerobic digester metagenome]
MYIDLGDIVIRDFERKDAPSLHRIVREKGILRFMRDWSEGGAHPEGYYGFIDWMQKHKDNTNVWQNRRFAVVQKENDELIGMVGMGEEDLLHEVEVAYFMSEAWQRKGLTVRAVNALVDWCFTVSDIPYLILTIDPANVPSCRLGEACGFELFEKRTPIGHKQSVMESDSYYYYRRYRQPTATN